MNLITLGVTAYEHKAEVTQAFGMFAAGSVALCAFAARFLPPAEKPGFYENLRAAVNWVAQNKGWAKNAQ
jgi:hypothetical protein